MKASELTEPGWYWYLPEVGSEWCIVEFDAHRDFYSTGSEIDEQASTMPGDFVGPLPPPPGEFFVVEHVRRTADGEVWRERCSLASIPDWAEHLFR